MDENKTFNISMPKALLDAIDKQAQTEFRNRSDLIREAARNYIASKGGMSAHDKLTRLEESRIKRALDFADLKNNPAIVIACTFRPQPNTVKDIFSTDSEAIKLLENPPTLRNMGWDLKTLDRARPVAGEYLELANGKKKVLRLYRDGQFIFSAGLDFFGHGVNQTVDLPTNFNLLSVAELILNFASFAQSIAEELQNGADLLLFNISVSNPQRKALTLHAYDGISTEKIGELSLDWAERNIVTRTEDSMPAEKIAYLIYSEFCYFFGLRSDELWYVDKKKQEITKDSFTRM